MRNFTGQQAGVPYGTSFPSMGPAGKAERTTYTPQIGNRDEDAIRHVQTLHDEWYKARYPYEPSWYLEVAYYLGLQWHSWHETDRTLREPRAPSYRVRLVINQILPMVRTMMGKLQRGVYRANVYPLQQSPVAYADARMGSRLLRAQYTNLAMEDVITEWLLWTIINGTGFCKVGFDPSIGQQIDLPDGTRVRMGEVSVDPVSPFSILVPTNVTDLTRPGRLIETKLIDLEELRSIYPDTAAKLKPDHGVRRESFYSQRVAGLVSPATYSYQSGKDMAHNSVYVSELWEDPEVLHEEDREQYPNGRVIVVANDQATLLSIHENPYRSWFPHQSKLPYVMIRDDRVPGRFWGLSRLDNLMAIQKSYNKGRSQMVEARNLVSQPKINVEQGHGIAKITNEPGQILERKKGWAAPQFMDPPRMSDYHFKDIEDSKRDFEEVAQQRAATRGEMPSANAPGIGINLLQEADNLPLNPLARQMAAGLSRMFTKVLERSHQFYDEERVFSFVGEQNQIDVFAFLADRHVTPLRAEVNVEAVLPEGRAARMARVQETIAMGVLDPVKHRSALLRMLEFGDIEQVWEDSDLDRQKQVRENRAMLMGEPRPVDEWDAHDIHVQELNRVRKAPEWESLPPEIQELFNQHAREHIDALLQAAGNMAGMASQSPQPRPTAPEPPIA